MPVVIIPAGLLLGLFLMFSGVWISIALLFVALSLALAIRDRAVRYFVNGFAYLRQSTIGTKKLSRDEILDVVVSRLKANQKLSRLGYRIDFRTGYVDDNNIYSSGPERYPQRLCQITLEFNHDVYNNLSVVRYVSIDKYKRIHIWKARPQVSNGSIKYRFGIYNSTFDPRKMDNIAIKRLDLAKSARVNQSKREEKKALIAKKGEVLAQKHQEHRRKLISRLLK